MLLGSNEVRHQEAINGPATNWGGRKEQHNRFGDGLASQRFKELVSKGMFEITNFPKKICEHLNMTTLTTATSKLDTLTLVPTRSDSTGLAGKNVSLLYKRPPCRRSVDQAPRVCMGYIVSTQIDEILKGEKLDRVTYFQRSTDSASDSAPMINVLLETLRGPNVYKN